MSPIGSVLFIGALAIGIGSVMLLVYLFLRRVETIIRIFLFRERVKKLTTELKQFGYKWVTYSKGGIIAVCTFQAFYEAVDNWKKKISENPEAMWGAQIIHVEPTFTFAAERMPVVTGGRYDLEDIAIDLIYDLLKGKYSKSFILKNVEDLGKVIAKRDSRLFVPFAGDKWQPEWEAHRHTDCQLARLRLHKEVLGALSSHS